MENNRMPPPCMKQIIKFVSLGCKKLFSRSGNNTPPIGQIVTGRSTRQHTADTYTKLGICQAILQKSLWCIHTYNLMKGHAQ